MTDEDAIRAAAQTVAGADHAVALTGAGISAESGVPTFRGDGGLWDRHDESDIHIRRFRADPAGFWEDWLAFHDDAAIDDAAPNPAHEALARLESGGHLEAVLTQNVDGLHTAAGSETVIELHGTHAIVECPDCGGRFDAEPVYERVRDGDLPPNCEQCGGVLKPGSVLFGQQLPNLAVQRANNHVRDCDCILVVGTSLEVQPVGSMPRRAMDTGAEAIVVNPDGTPIDDRATQVFHAPAGYVLPRIEAEVPDIDL